MCANGLLKFIILKGLGPFSVHNFFGICIVSLTREATPIDLRGI